MIVHKGSRKTELTGVLDLLFYLYLTPLVLSVFFPILPQKRPEDRTRIEYYPTLDKRIQMFL